MTNTRVTITQAAQELHLTPQTVRVMMTSGTLPIGDVMRRRGAKRTAYFIYRKMLDEEKRKRGIE